MFMNITEYIRLHKCQKGRAWSSPDQEKAIARLPATCSEVAAHLGKPAQATKCMMWRLKQRGIVEHGKRTRCGEVTWSLVGR